MSIFIIAEIGINHNGDMDLVKKLIDASLDAGADAVKFQKRSLEKVYTKEELDQERESPWGKTNREQKRGLELTKEDYDQIDRYCKDKGIYWFASAWDAESQMFLSQFDCKYNKVASARITHKEILKLIASEGKHTFISTGMASYEEIGTAVDIFKAENCPFELMHCVSTYPAKPETLNLNCIQTLKERFSCNVGYSGHETGLAPSLAAVALGATSLERHITLDRSMYGSDQSASVEPHGFKNLITNVRALENALGDGVKKVLKEEEEIAKKLKRDKDL